MNEIEQHRNTKEKKTHNAEEKEGPEEPLQKYLYFGERFQIHL